MGRMNFTPQEIHDLAIRAVLHALDHPSQKSITIDASSSAYKHDRFDSEKLLDLQYTFDDQGFKQGVWLMHHKTLHEIQQEDNINEWALRGVILMGLPIVTSYICPQDAIYLIDTGMISDFQSIFGVEGVKSVRTRK